VGVREGLRVKWDASMEMWMGVDVSVCVRV